MSLKIVIISDTHERHSYVIVPDGDILIHCGDWTNRGDHAAIKKFLYWFWRHPHKQKVLISGNHELSLEGANRPNSLKLINDYVNDNFHFLENSGATIEGLKFYGSPATPFFCNWAFNFQRGKDIAAEWKKIPDDVNVLITHGPSHGFLDLVEDIPSNKGRDLHQGCEDLSKRIQDLKELKLHCFGHLHTDGGKSVIENGIIRVNAAICTEQYQPINPPVVIDL
jgi:Icc-related predicted phosphoesterase